MADVTPESLAAREAALIAREQALEAREASLVAKEADIAAREAALAPPAVEEVKEDGVPEPVVEDVAPVVPESAPVTEDTVPEPVVEEVAPVVSCRFSLYFPCRPPSLCQCTLSRQVAPFLSCIA